MDYALTLQEIMQTPAYAGASPEEQQGMLRVFRDDYIKDNPNQADFANSVTEQANVEHLRASGQGRYIPTNLNIDAPWSNEGWGYLTEEEKQTKLNEFRQKIPEYAGQDPINRGDIDFFLNQVTDQQERKAKGEDTGWIADKGYRAWDGFAAGLASYVGATEIADKIRSSTSENPNYDEDFTAQLFQGAGDMAASTAIFIGATLGGTAITGNPIAGAYLGSTATLGTNSLARYNDAYKQAIDLGLSEKQANDAGIGSLPGAAIDSIGDKLIAGKFLPNGASKIFKTGTQDAKKKLLSELLADTSTRGIMLNTAKDAFMEGASEAVGDYVAGYGAFLQTGEEEFVPKDKDLRNSFIIGAVLGGGVSAASSLPGVVRGDHKTLQETEQEIDRSENGLATDEQASTQINQLLRTGDFKGALDIAKQVETIPYEESVEAIEDSNNIQPTNQTFVPTNEAEETLPYKATPIAASASPEFTEEQAALDKLKGTTEGLQTEFNEAIRLQYGAYANNVAELNEGLGIQPFAETVDPVSSIRRGVSEGLTLQTPADGLAQQMSQRYNNIKIVAPGTSPTKGTADFSIKNRSAPEGEVQVGASPNLQTKIQEEVGRGRAGDIRYLAPVNETDATFLTDNNIPGININFDGIETQEYEDGSGTRTVATTEEAVNKLADEFDAQYGENQWILKDSLGAAGSGIVATREQVIDKFKQQGELELNGWYVEPFRKNLSDNGNPRSDFRVHLVKRGGRMEVVPYATTSRGSTLPFLVRTQSLLGIEDAALNEAEKVVDKVGENGLLGVDVVVNNDGQLEVTELNPTQFGDIAASYDGSGTSGFAGTPYVQSAIYSHLKGRVPAFALAGRKAMRDEHHRQQLAKGANFIASRIKNIYGNAKDSIQLKQELIRTYGEQMGDKAEQLWQAFKESAGQITKKILDIIQSVIDRLTWKPVNTNVSPANQALMQKATVNATLNKNVVNALTEVNRASEQSSDPNRTIEGFPINGLELFDQVAERSSYLSNLIGTNETIRNYLSTVPVINSFENSFDGEVIRITPAQRNDLETNEHELTHAVLEYALRSDPEFNREMTSIVAEMQSALAADTSQSGININSFLDDVKRRMGINRPDRALSSFIGQNYTTLRELNKLKPAKERVNYNEFGVAYGLSSPSEFLAQLFSSEYFRNYINKLEPKKNWIQRIVDAVKKFFTGKVDNVDRIANQVKKYLNSDKFDVKRKSFKDFVYRPSEPEQLRKRQLEILKRLKQHKIEDKFDSNTSSLLKAVDKLKPSEIGLLPPEDQSRIYDILQNIYEARSQQVNNPQARETTSKLINELNNFQSWIDSVVIQKIIKDMDGVFDLASVYKGDLDDRAAFESFVNELATNDQAFQEAKKNKSATKRNRYNQKMQKWRENYNTLRTSILDQFPTAEDWVAHLEEQQGQPIKGKKLRDFLLMHFDYLVSLANPTAMEGGDLYRHYFALNNVKDGSLMYGPETTVKYIQNLRDSKININSLAEKFRDPVINQGRGILGGLDAAQRQTEIAQTQLQRWSAFTDGKDFLQKDLMGPLLESIIIEAKNSEEAGLARYGNLKTEFEKAIKREMNSQDRVTLAITSRLIQFRNGTDANKEFINNLRNERKAIANIVGDGKTQGAGTDSQQSEYNEVIIPILNQLTDGLQDSTTPMDDFINNIAMRMGLGDPAVGQARTDLLSGMQDIIGEYTLDNKVVSELFYKKPFKQYANYMPRLIININSEQTDARNATIADEIEAFEDDNFQTNSFTAQPEQLKERQGIGKNAHYSPNIEFIFSRGLHVSSLTSATTSERHILNERLKNSTIRDLINGSNSTYRVDQLQQWARQVMLHAMHAGQPLGPLGVVMKTINENFARVALSGIHQGATQTVSGFVDYQFRTGNIGGAMEAASYYITNKKKMDEFFARNAAWIGNRSFLGEQELDRRRNPPIDEKKFMNSPLMKQLSKYHEKAGEIITYSLRKGDDFSSRTLVMAEYVRQLKQKNPAIKSIHDVDWQVPEGNILSNAVLDVEQNINASNKVTRGEFFVDRNKGTAMLRNVLVAFSSHTMMLAGQFNIAVRDLVDLHNRGGSKADKVRALRTIGAILGQTFSFSTSRYVINGALATAMIGLMRDLYDDEDGKIAALTQRVQLAKDMGDEVMEANATYELQAATKIKKQIDKFSQRQLGFQSYWKNMVKDELNTVHFMFNGPQLPQKLVFPFFDNFGEMMMKEDKEARVTRMKARIKILKEQGRFGEAARIGEDLVLVENAEYLPWNVDEFGNLNMGGITGTALNGVYSSIKEINDRMYGLTELNANDFMLSAQAYGIGQADLNRFFRTIDKIEDEQFTQQRKKKELKEQIQLRKREEAAALESLNEREALDEVLNN